MVRSMTAEITGIDLGQIKVTASEIGRGFGGKTTVYVEPVAAVLAPSAAPTAAGTQAERVRFARETFAHQITVSPTGRDEYLAGWHAEEYQVDLEQGWAEGLKRVEERQRGRCARDVPWICGLSCMLRKRPIEIAQLTGKVAGDCVRL